MASAVGSIGAADHASSASGVWSWITTVDHKRIGVLYGVTGILFFFVGGAEAFLIRLQLASAESDLISSSMFSQLFTMHALTMVFLAIMPMGAAFFNFLIPLQIGARDVAFPRLNALSYWLFLFGGILLNSSFLFGGAPDAGWFAYANLTSTTYSPGNSMDYFTLGLLVLGVSSLAAALNFVITILNMRAPGMTLMRMPVFTWMALIVSFLLVFALPILTVGLIQLLFWRFWDMPFFAAEFGGDPLLWQHIFWLFGHPEVYILILPAMGIVSEILPTYARKPLFGYTAVVLAGVSIAFLGFAVWAHHMFTVGLGPVAIAAFSASTMVIAVPTGVKVFNWICTLYGGSLELKTAMLFSLGFVALFVIGGLSGVMHASPPVDMQQSDTYFIVAHLHYVLFGGSIMGLMAGIYFWFPKLTGRLMGEGLGVLHFWLMFIGMNVTFGPMHLVGIMGMPRRIYTYPESSGWEFLNQLESLGAVILALGMIVFAINVIRSLRSGEVAGDDPWDGRTLEWSISSPPPVYNFAAVPVVYSKEPFWDQKYPELAHDKPPAGAVAPVAEDPASIHMPNPSYWPIVIAFGATLAAGLVIVNPYYAFIGGAITVLGSYGWVFEPAGPEEHH